MLVKKKTLKIAIIVAVALIILIAIGLALAPKIKIAMQIKQTEDKLSKINAKELETKIIDELKSTQLNVSNININTKQAGLSMSTEFTDSKTFPGYTSAIITGNWKNGNIDKFEIPCFKIKKDSNGNFINIEYIEKLWKDKYIIRGAVQDVFENEYNINFHAYDYEFKERFFKDNKSATITFSGNDFYLFVVGLIEKENYLTKYTDNIPTEIKGYTTKIFGLDFDTK